MRNEMMIREFIATMPEGRNWHVRLNTTSRMFDRATMTQIRTKKNTAIAFCWDEIDNVTVLHADGGYRQYTSREEAKAAGLFR